MSIATTPPFTTSHSNGCYLMQFMFSNIIHCWGSVCVRPYGRSLHYFDSMTNFLWVRFLLHFPIFVIVHCCYYCYFSCFRTVSFPSARNVLVGGCVIAAAVMVVRTQQWQIQHESIVADVYGCDNMCWWLQLRTYCCSNNANHCDSFDFRFVKGQLDGPLLCYRIYIFMNGFISTSFRRLHRINALVARAL